MTSQGLPSPNGLTYRALTPTEAIVGRRERDLEEQRCRLGLKGKDQKSSSALHDLLRLNPDDTGEPGEICRLTAPIGDAAE